MFRTLIAAVTAAALVAGCSKPADKGQAAAPAGGVAVSGAGATFPAPLYAKWAELQKAETGLTLNYQPIGSGGGVKQIIARTVAFGAPTSR
jgi:phosphate transport system substrate-binding protein